MKKTTKNKQAFTLIELLVVVLIIGILAAVALPQYQLAVAKTKYAKSMHYARLLAEAQERFYLAHGTYSTHFDNLDISFPGDYISTPKARGEKRVYDWGTCHLTTESVFCYDKGALNLHQVYLKYSDGHYVPPGTKVCTAYSTDLNSVANKLCKQETHRTNFKARLFSGGDYGIGYTEWLYPANL